MAPTTGEAVPAAHSWHTVLEVSAYVPVPHCCTATCELRLDEITVAVDRFCACSCWFREFCWMVELSVAFKICTCTLIWDKVEGRIRSSMKT